MTPLAWLVAPAVPFTVAFYFLLAARASRAVPTSAVVGQATVGAGVVSLALSPILPGGVAGLLVPSAHDLLFLVALGLTSFFLAAVFYFKAIELAGLLLPALLMATIPLFTVVVQLAAFSTTPTEVALLGIPIAVAGGILALRGAHPGWTPTYEVAGELTAK